jgi:TusA-related sulfurtransferase
VVVKKIEQPNTNTIIEVVETVANTSNDIPMFVEIDLTNQ